MGTRTLLWFTAVLVLSLSSRHALRSANQDRCSLDGSRLVPIYRVDQMLDGAPVASFCCVTCAAEWPESPAGAYWRVRDEVTGQPLDAAVACFVQSTVITVPARQDRVHVFRSWVDALEHLEEFGGSRLTDPFKLAPSDEPAPSPAGDSRPAATGIPEGIPDGQ